MNQAKITAAAQGIIETVYQRGVPQQFPRLIFWLGKPHGDAWQDEYQNALIDAFIQSPHLTYIEPGTYRCTVSGQEWTYTEWEWRMNAVKKTIKPKTPIETATIIGAPLDTEAVNLIGEWSATAGFEPTEKHQLTLSEWERWLLQ